MLNETFSVIFKYRVLTANFQSMAEDRDVGNFLPLVALATLLYCVVFKRKLFKAPKTPFQSTLWIFRPNWSWEKVITLQEFF